MSSRMVIAVYETRGPKRLVARVRTDGESGSFELLVPEYERALRALFTSRQTPLAGVGVTNAGAAYVAVEKVYEPWRPETVRWVIEHRLAPRGLRGELRSAP